MIELNGENYLDGREASHLLGIKLSTLYTYVSRGIVKSYKQGIKRQRWYKQVELEALLHLHADVATTTDPHLTTSGQQTELPHAEDWVPNI